jgi:hypothetical protein
MPLKKAQPPIKKGRGRPPKSAATPSSKAAIPTNTPSKRGRGRPPRSAPTLEPTTAFPARKRGRPSLATSPPNKKRGRPSYPKPPAKIPSAGVKKRGRPVGSTNAKKAATATKTKAIAKAKTSAVAKGGRPKGKHVSNLSSNLKSLISGASKGRLVELLSVLCERNAVVAKATSSALREEKMQREDRDEGEIVVEETGEAGEEDGVEETITVHASGKTNGVGKAKGAKAKASKDATSSAEKSAQVPHTHHITVDEDQQVHTEQGTEPTSGYEADVEPEIPATATEAGEDGEDATAETGTIVQVVSSIRDSAFAL